MDDVTGAHSSYGWTGSAEMTQQIFLRTMLCRFWIQSRIDHKYLLIEASRTTNLAYRCDSLTGGIGV